jgi:hypothetical protein
VQPAPEDHHPHLALNPKEIVMSDQIQPAVTMRQARQALGHNVPPDDLPEPIARPTAYSVNQLPEGDVNAPVFEITVEYRGEGRWAVTRHGACLGTDGEWADGIKPYGRDDDWLAAHRFDLDAALAAAKRAAPQVMCNGVTAADALRRTAAAQTPGATL